MAVYKVRIRILLFILIFICYSLAAQTIQTGSISGVVMDSVSKNKLPLSTVSIFNAKDTTLVTYRMTNGNGEFKVTGLPINVDLRVMITYSGYSVYRHNFRLISTKSSLHLDTVCLQIDFNKLDDILVYAERPPVIIKKDTIEFNASSFKTLPTALLENLLKKLPGIEINEDGSISANGKKVNRILVEGKDFFGGDVKIATKNLPANMIEKVQITNDADEYEQNRNRSKSALGQVINLKLKKGIKKGWFGKSFIGGGTDNRYEIGSIINTFRDTLQISILGSSNNLNRSSFGSGDVLNLGGFNRSGVSSVSTRANGGLGLNGLSFGGLGQGIERSIITGFNLNNDFKNGLLFNMQYFYGSSKNKVEEIVNRQQIYKDTIFNSYNTNNELASQNAHKFFFRFKKKFPKNVTFDYRPDISFISQNSNKDNYIINSGNYSQFIGSNSNLQKIISENFNYSHTLSITKKFSTVGKSLNFYQRLIYIKEEFSKSNNIKDTLSSSLINRFDQLRSITQNNNNIISILTYVQPLIKNIDLKLINNFTYDKNSDNIKTSFLDTIKGEYNINIDSLSNISFQKVYKNTSTIGLDFVVNDLNFMIALNGIYFNTSYEYSKSNLLKHNKRALFFPSVNINFKELSFEYSSTINAPNNNFLQPIPDNTNLLSILKGNPDLVPYLQHTLYLNYSKNFIKNNIFINTYVNGDFFEEAIVFKRTLNKDGVQESSPINSEGYSNFYHFFNISKKYLLKNSSYYTVRLGYNLNFSRSFLQFNQFSDFATNTDFAPYIRVGVNYKDKVEFNINLKKEFNSAKYKNKVFENITIKRIGISSDIVLRFSKKLVFEAAFNYRGLPSAIPSIQNNVTLLNFGTTFLFLKDNKGQIKLSLFDVLNENQTIGRTVVENSITDRQVFSLRRYLMVTFFYDIRNFKTKKIGGKESLLQF